MMNAEKKLAKVEIRFAEALFGLLKALSGYECQHEHLVDASTYGFDREEGSVMVTSTVPFTQVYLTDLKEQSWPKSLRLVSYAFELYSEQPGCENDGSIREVCSKAAVLICLCEEYPNVYITQDIENVLGEMLRDKYEYGGIAIHRGFNPSDLPGDVRKLRLILLELLNNLIIMGFDRDARLLIDIWKKRVEEMPDGD